jgi:hypothetical protein
MGKWKTSIQRWEMEARALPSDEVRLTVPLHVLTGEAVDVSRFFVKYWATQRDPATRRVVRPGLDMAGGEKRLSAETGADILSLQDAVQQAQTAYLLTVDPKAERDAMERAAFVLGELTSTLEWLFDDGVQNDDDVRLANLGAAHHDDPETPDALASALEDYAGLAALHRKEMDGLGGFDVALIDEAKELAKKLRGIPAAGPASADSASKQALDLRNRLATLLMRKIGTVRAATRFVFRHHPEIIREVTSTYERRRRAAARRNAAKKQAQQPANG